MIAWAPLCITTVPPRACCHMTRTLTRPLALYTHTPLRGRGVFALKSGGVCPQYVYLLVFSVCIECIRSADASTSRYARIRVGIRVAKHCIHTPNLIHVSRSDTLARYILNTLLETCILMATADTRSDTREYTPIHALRPYDAFTARYSLPALYLECIRKYRMRIRSV